MAERYSRLFTLGKPRYLEGSPVSIEAGALLLDNSSGRVLAQLKFKNLTEKRIIALTAEIQPFDVAGRAVGAAVKHNYLDLSERTLFEFGSKIPVYLPDSLARSFEARVTEVVFDGGGLWSNDAPFEEMKDSVEIKDAIGGSEMAKQYAIETGTKGIYLPERYKDLAYCVCGARYKSSIKSCPTCGKSLDFLIEKLDKDTIKQKMNERLERENRAKEERLAAEQARLAAEARAAEEKRIKTEKIKKKAVKAAKIGIPIAAAVVIFIVLLNTLILPPIAYNNAEKLMAEQNYTGALSEYLRAKNFSDAKEKSEDLLYKLDMRKTVSAGGYHTVALRNDGTVVAVGYGKNGQSNVGNWTDIAAVSAGSVHTVGLKKDGTVVAVGYEENGRCEVSNWTDIASVSAGYSHTVGLKKDGRVIAVGNDGNGQCNVGGWTDIVAVAAGGYHTVGLKKDGTVVAVGNDGNGQCNVGGWTDIVAVAAGSNHTVGLKKDGTVVAVGINGYGQCDVGKWKDIVTVSAGYSHTVGLKKDGTVVAVGANDYGQCNVGEWKDIAAVSSGEYHTVGLKKDGTVVAVGSNRFGQCDVGGWTNIKLP